MKRQIELRYGGLVEHDDEVPESTIRREMGSTFFNVKGFGKRQTFDFYRGFIICRGTVTFTDCKPERRTSLYIYFPDLEGSSNVLCITDCGDSIKSAKDRVDRILASGKIAE